MTTTSTFRDYQDGVNDGEHAVFSIATSRVGGSDQALLVMEFGDVEMSTFLTVDTARLLGTTILQWAGNPSLFGNHLFQQDDQYPVELIAEDGEITIGIDDGEDSTSHVEFMMSKDQAIDLGQRLIVFAGVAL